MKRIFTILFLLAFTSSFAQKRKLIVDGYVPGLYFIYDVQPKETFSTIAAIYNLNPDSLSEFNNIDFYEGELRAKTIRIPLTPANFTQEGIADTLEALIPVYHPVRYNESLQQISSKVNRIPIAAIQKWNELAGNPVPKGTNVLIGFLKAKQDYLSYFENPVSAEFAKFELPPSIKATKAKPDTSSLVAKVEVDNTRTPDVLPSKVKPDSTVTTNAAQRPNKTNVAKPKADTASLAINSNKKPLTKKPGTTKIKADSSSVASNPRKETNEKINIEKSKADTASLAINTNKKPETKNAETTKIVTTKIKDHSTSVVSNPGKKTNDVEKGKTDTASLAINTNKKPETKNIESVKPGTKIKTKDDSTSVVSNPGKKTNNVEKGKTDTASLAINTNKKPEADKVVSNNSVDNTSLPAKRSEKSVDNNIVTKPAAKADSLAVASKPVNVPADKNSPVVKPPKTPKADSNTLIITSIDKPANTKIVEKNLDSKEDATLTALTNQNKVVAKLPEEKATPNTKTDPSALSANINKDVTTAAKPAIETSSAKPNLPAENNKLTEDRNLNATGSNTGSSKNIVTPSTNTVTEAIKRPAVENVTLGFANFASIYSSETAVKTEKRLVGEASYFQSKSGWSDKKFYVLIPNVTPGTVVKVTSNDNRSVYAKVLGAMPDMKENDGIMLRLSDAAVAALGVQKDKFPVTITYY